MSELEPTDPLRRRSLTRRFVLRRLAFGVVSLTALAACQRAEIITQAALPTPESTSPPPPTVTPTLEPASAIPSSTPEPIPTPQTVPAVVGRPMYQMDPQHTGRSPHVGPRERQPAPHIRDRQLPGPDNRTPSGADIQSSAAIGAGRHDLHRQPPRRAVRAARPSRPRAVTDHARARGAPARLALPSAGGVVVALHARPGRRMARSIWASARRQHRQPPTARCTRCARPDDGIEARCCGR